MNKAVRLLALIAASAASIGQTPVTIEAPAPSAAEPTEGAVAEPSPAVRALQSDLQEILDVPGWGDARYGVIVVSLERGDTLFARNPDLLLAPASNQKLLTTAAALYYLGPDFRYATYALADGEIVNGVLRGDLILYGTGDPALSRRMLDSTTTALHTLADSLYARGVREIEGAVVGDGSYFDADWIGTGWKASDRMAWYAAPVGALGFAENLVSIRVLPGAPGEPARIRTSPETAELAVGNEVQTVSRGGTRIEFEHAADRLVIRGQIRPGHPGISRSLPVVDPANYAAAAFHAVLEERGIEVRGGVQSVRAPAESPVAMLGGESATDRSPPQVLAAHLSPSLAEILRVTNHISHNLYAEALFKTVGRVALGEGSFAGGARAVEYFLECETDVDPADLRLVDGSGLSRFNRVSARTLLQLLDYMSRSDGWEPFYASLPAAAAPNDLQHSLRRRMEESGAAGNLRAKTGTIKDVSALSGYVNAANGERLAFSIIVNDAPSTWRAKRLEDAIGARLAGFQRPSALPGTDTARR